MASRKTQTVETALVRELSCKKGKPARRIKEDSTPFNHVQSPNQLRRGQVVRRWQGNRPVPHAEGQLIIIEDKPWSDHEGCLWVHYWDAREQNLKRQMRLADWGVVPFRGTNKWNHYQWLEIVAEATEEVSND